MRAVCLSIAFAFCGGVLPLSAQAVIAKYDLNIPRQSLDAALKEFAQQTGLQIARFSDTIDGSAVVGPISGQLSAEEALTSLLGPEGLSYKVVNERTIAVLNPKELPSGTKTTSSLFRAPGGAERSAPGAAGNGNDERRGFWNRIRLAQASESSVPRGESEAQRDARRAIDGTVDTDLGEIVVTGTHIRGARPTAPVVTITQQEMRLAGHNNLGEAVRALPQNFNGGQNPGVTLASNVGGNFANQNVTGASSINLRGLGPDATLTLLNGTRFAYDGISQAIDVSVIPLAAIERVEVLLDGASAIYGSDAVGGVANIVLKRDYEGAELSARFGGATDGGFEQQQYTAVAGTHWDSGGFLVAGDYSHNDSVEAGQRDYLGQLANQDLTIYPQLSQEGALFSGHQQIATRAEFDLDAFYTERSQETLSQTSAPSFVAADADTSIWGAAPALNFALPGEWSARLHGAVGRNETDSTSTTFSVATGAQTARSLTAYFNEMRTAGMEAEGPLFALPGGQARLSVGGGYRKNTFDRTITNLVTGAVLQAVAGEESSRYVYGEVDLPLVSAEQEVPLVTQLSLNAALRHENYDAFGESTTPKIGVIWGLAPRFDLKASWGRSFKAPTAFQQYRAVDLILEGGPSYGAPTGSQVLRLGGGNPELDPEEAEIVTAGFVARPDFLPGLTLEASYFDIDYTDRVAFPIDVLAQALSNPVFAEFVTPSPSTTQQNAAFAAAGLPVGTILFNSAGAPYNPAAVIAIVDNVNTNVSSQHVRGVDLIARYTVGLFGGDFSLSANGDWITDGTRNLTELSSELPAAGVNFWPAKFRGRFGAGWSRQGFTLSANLNHTDGITDRNVTPNVKRGSMTTVDLIVDYRKDTELLGDVGLNLAVTNVFNEEPPFLQPPLQPLFIVSYDSTNYSALGRVVSATITKRF